MGNLKIMKYYSGVIFIGMDGIFIFMYISISMHSLPYLCVWRWSGNLLSGSIWCFKWAKSCL